MINAQHDGKLQDINGNDLFALKLGIVNGLERAREWERVETYRYTT